MTRSDQPPISPTAKIAAYLLAQSDIKYCRRIAQICGAEETAREILGDKLEAVLKHAAAAELRLKSLNALLKQTDIRHILELGSGTGPTGLIWTDDPEVIYIETDLPEVIQEKSKIINEISGGKGRRNLRCWSLNVTKWRDWDTIRSPLKPVPLAIIHEGLLHLNYSDIGLAALNIHETLKRQGGVWITPDIFTKKRYERLLQDDETWQINEIIMGITGKNLLANCFEDDAEAESFFNQYKLEVTKYRQMDLVPTLSIENAGLVREQMEQDEIWMMRAK